MDLADQVDDYICSFEGLGDMTMDSLAIFLFLWAVLALFSLWLCKYLYQKYGKTKDPNGAASTIASTGSGSGSANATGGVAALSRQSSTASGGSGARLSEPRELTSTVNKVEVRDVLNKPTTLATGGGGGGSIIGKSLATTQPGTTLRRRMVRQGSTGPESRRKRYVPPPSNVVGPETTSVTWTSQVFRWLYSDLVIINELLMSWVIALNDTLRKLTSEHGIVVEAIRVLPDSPPPALSNIFCNADESNPSDMLITFDCDAMPVLQVKTSRHKAGKLESSHYKVTVSRFRARLANTMNYNSLKGEMRIDGYPDIRINMNSVGPVKPVEPDEQQFESIVTDILARALQDTIYPVDFSIYSTCPRGELELQDLPVIYPSSYDPLANQMMMNETTTPRAMVAGRRLLVKIVAGDGLKDAINPYVVIEMDEPAQKNQTAKQSGPQPQWDEHFLFDLSPQSAEILFEVYDGADSASNNGTKFLGLGLVGIDELAVGPAVTQILALQPRPYEAQNVYGSIIVDFVFIEGAEIPAIASSYRLREALHLSTPAITEHIKNGANLADAAVRALKEGALSANNGQPSKSTLIIHSVQRNNSGNTFAFTKAEINKDDERKADENEEQQDQGTNMNTKTNSDRNEDENENESEVKGTEAAIGMTIATDHTDSYQNGKTPTPSGKGFHDIKSMIDGTVVATGKAETASPELISSTTSTGTTASTITTKATAATAAGASAAATITTTAIMNNDNNNNNNNNNDNDNNLLESSLMIELGIPQAVSSPNGPAISNNNVYVNNIHNDEHRHAVMNNNTATTPTNQTGITTNGMRLQLNVDGGGGGGGGGRAGVGTSATASATATAVASGSSAGGGGQLDTSMPLDIDERGRSKKRNFFGTLKKRLSRSKTRTQSADRGNLLSRSQYNSNNNNNNNSNNNCFNDPTTTTAINNNNNANATANIGTFNGESRSLSVDRAVLSKNDSFGRRTAAGMSPTLDHSRRSSLSESSAISGFSTASTKTYIHEASTLVLETIENGIKRHFIVPLNIAQRPRWRRKGTKLHIYNDHTFIAKHLSGSGLQCSICMKSIPRRPGKQGYECRDCHMICHKQCHVRAPQACPNPTVLSMELSKLNLNSMVGDRSLKKS